MQYDFTTFYARKGLDAPAVVSPGCGRGFAPGGPGEGFDLIPMWIADMNFATVPAVTEAIIRRARHPLFGYFDPSRAYYDAIIRWHASRKGVGDLTEECIGYENGVLGGVVSALNVLCSKGDSVLVHSPTYIGFTNSLGRNGYKIIHSPLALDEDGVWRMDFEDMERKLARHHIHACVFCSPHNPCGRVWERWEIEKAMALFEKYGVYVISDEIWSDIIRPGFRHVPTQSVSEDARMRTVALYAPSKTFNLAGLVGSYHVAYNPWLRDRIAKESALPHYNEMNVLSMHALIGGYSDEGAAWVDELNQVLAKNIDYFCDAVKQWPGVTCAKPQGTYMVFVDCSEWCREHGVSIDEVERRAWDVGVAVQDGRMFHGPCHLRVNLALPFAKVEEAVNRLNKYVFTT